MKRSSFGRILTIALLALLPFVLYGRNLDDYFLGDDFDLIHSIYDQPASYIVGLLYSNESGDVWDSMCMAPGACIDPEHHGFLRPLKMWSLWLDLALWGPNSIGFHVTSTLFFSLNVTLVFLILRTLLPVGSPFPLLGAMLTLFHPVFAYVVPFIVVRDETLVSGAALASVFFFLRHRQDGRSPLGFYVCYALALLSKESGIVVVGLVAGYDLVASLSSRERAQEIVRRAWLYLPIVPLLIGYFALRYVAFRNFMGGHGHGETDFLSLSSFLEFHAYFLHGFLFSEPMMSAHSLPFVRGAAAVAVGLMLATILGRRHRLATSTWQNLSFAGPVWYLCASTLAHGVYHFAAHNVMLVLGVILFAVCLLDAFCRAAALGLGMQRWVAAAGVVVSAFLFLPPGWQTAGSYERASRTVAAMRQFIADETRHLPPGSKIRLENVPQLGVPPYYFGWGLLSALQKPFTASNLAIESTVINLKNVEMNRYRFEIPKEYDLRLDLARGPQGWKAQGEGRERGRRQGRWRREGTGVVEGDLPEP